jgi:uncharacterized protein YbcC (UPF0753/DUF2309 family)
LQNVIACNPLQGFEDLKFQNALKEGFRFFQRGDIPQKLEIINQITIKWCQVFFDQGQATIKMPNRDKGFYAAWKDLAKFDDQIHQKKSENIETISNLANSSKEAIFNILKGLKLDKNSQEEFLTLLLTTLSGWSAYVKYLEEWSYQKSSDIEADYLAIRLIITSIIWPEASTELVSWSKEYHYKNRIDEILANEKNHREALLKQIESNYSLDKCSVKKPEAQLILCIDVRSEPFRKSLESCGNYETFGFAGFFGIPTSVTNELTKETYSSCPVLLSPKHNVFEVSTCSKKESLSQAKGHKTLFEIKNFYQSLKYNFTTPLPLAEAMGLWSGGWMLLKTFSPNSKKILHKKFQNALKQQPNSLPEIGSISFEEKLGYAAGALKAIGLVDNFAKIVLLCGHGSQTENNTFATALDCGACGGRHGDVNAKILAKILNEKQVRDGLEKDGIKIPKSTKFIAAKHNTTNDEVEIYDHDCLGVKGLDQLKKDLLKAKRINNACRASQMGFDDKKESLEKFFFDRSHSWSEVQPEWGLAKNASFIVAPRSLTKDINLGGRSFLHSYDWRVDEDGAILNLILNAPMIVAQWINSQYLFSTIDNVAFGAGSKITQNIVGKIGVMQGNGSDLMHGLPLQSVYFDDQLPYHKPARLTTLVYAPSDKIDGVIANSPKLQQLFVNEWVFLICINPRDGKKYFLQKDLTWTNLG